MQNQDKNRAYAALHEARTNEWISQAEYEAELRKLNGGNWQTIVIAALLIALFVALRIWGML